MLGTILSPAYLKCSAVSVHPSEILPVFNFPIERWISSSLNFVFMPSFAVCCTILLMSEYRYSQSSRWSLSKCSSLDGIANDS